MPPPSLAQLVVGWSALSYALHFSDRQLDERSLLKMSSSYVECWPPVSEGVLELDEGDVISITCIFSWYAFEMLLNAHILCKIYAFIY
jgi:hypothetical protein